MDAITKIESANGEQFVIDRIRDLRLAFQVNDEVIAEMRRRHASERLIKVAKECELSVDEMLQYAETDLQAGRFQQAAATAEEAAAVKPSVRAWDLVATARLRNRDVAGAHEAQLKSIQVGGGISADVVVAPTGENFNNPCPGKLAISRTHLTINASKECRLALDLQNPQIVEAAANEFVGVDRHALHITVQTPQGEIRNVCLAPAEGGKETTDWLLRILSVVKQP
ncbi:MAG: hypothetical protein LAQ69_32730 [Acidobacteriia bacterium]|nr:hypothetical protein [Terriglobia bacterium]